MYYGRIAAFMIGECDAVSVGAARGALDLFEVLLRTETQTQQPTLELYQDAEFLHYYGKALTRIVTAEAALLQAGNDYLTYCREDAEGIAPFDLKREYRVSLTELTCIELAWEAIDIVYKEAGTSASVKAAQPIGRVMRNVAAIRTHPILQLDRTAMKAAKVEFGLA
jgi:3-hydroxy-9,10-secoandrosta-1,3,5(10)-triene-9,17-dione monooxygenase